MFTNHGARIEFDRNGKVRGDAEKRSGNQEEYLLAIGCPPEIAALASMPPAKAQATIRTMEQRGVKVADGSAFRSATAFDAYAKRRAKELARVVAVDEMQLMNDRAWRQVDELNRREAATIAHRIAAVDAALRSAEEADDELRRRMELAAGRLRK